MDNSWHPRPIQGNNLCPTCSMSHFPFCPPHPNSSTFPGPTFEPIRGPSHMGRPVFNNHPDPFRGPGNWNMDPNLPPQLGQFNNSYNNNNNWNNNVSDDRSSKRTRVDGGEFNVKLSKNMGYDHGRVNSGLGFDGGVRSYPVENPYPVQNPGFDRNVGGGREGVNSMMSNNFETGYRPEYGLGYNTNRSAYGVEGGNFGGDHQVGRYGHVAKPPNPESFSHGGFGYDNDRQSHGYRPPNYGSSFEHLQSNGAAMHYDKRSSMVMPPPPPDQYASTYPPLPTDMGYDYRSPHHIGGVRQPVDSRPHLVEGYQNVSVPTQPGYVAPRMSKQSEYGNAGLEHGGQFQPQKIYEFQPPLPSSPPPPLPMEPRVPWSVERKYSSPPKNESQSFFPSHVRSSAAVPYSHSPNIDSHGRASPHLDNFKNDHAPRRTFQEDSQGMLTKFGQYPGGNQPLPSKHNRPEKPTAVDAAHLFKQPHRTSRSDHFVIILRGLPGSGKSYFAKMLRDLELEHGGSAPRIHSMDDYFMTEVEKTEEKASKSLGRGKKPVTKTVIEYCYEPEMEEAYRSSMLKSFKKTLEEGVYTFVIVDDRNLRVADFAQFWATAKRSGYEAYLLEAPYKDPAGCAARNVHGFTQDEVEKMAAKWEEAPALYLQLDVKSLLHGDDLKDGNIEEVDMDAEDEDFDASESQAEKPSLTGKLRPDVSAEDERNSDDTELDNHAEEVKHLGRSKWSNNLDDDGDEETELFKGKPNVLSGLLGTYGKEEGRSVQWSDQGVRLGFSIGKAKMASLIIGPGAGYNLKSNPLHEEEMRGKFGEKKKHSAFKARLQAEQEAFRAVFDRRRQRIGGVLTEDE